jgi:hypothetical protein
MPGRGQADWLAVRIRREGGLAPEAARLGSSRDDSIGSRSNGRSADG